MSEKGKIREIRGKTIIVAPEISDSCFGCMKMECKANGGILFAENIMDLHLEIGQTVELKRQKSPILGQSVLALLPPAIGFIGSFILIRLLFPEAKDATAAFIGVIMLFLFAFFIYRIRKKIPVKTSLPYIERILT